MSTDPGFPRGFKVPILPKWCDYHTYSVPQKLIFIGVVRIILLIISISLCIVFLTKENHILALQVVLGTLIFSNFVQIFIVYISYIAWSGTLGQRRWWIYGDLAALMIYIISVAVTLCLVSVSDISLIIALKIIYLLGLLGYRRSMLCLRALNSTIPYQVQT